MIKLLSLRSVFVLPNWEGKSGGVIETLTVKERVLSAVWGPSVRLMGGTGNLDHKSRIQDAVGMV